MKKEQNFGVIGQKPDNYYPMVFALLEIDSYRSFDLGPDEFEAFLQEKEFKGLNIALPYKAEALKYCDALSDDARRTGYVNVVIKRDDGTLYGHNTDIEAFQYLLRSRNIQLAGRQCLVLGTGCISRSVCSALEEIGASEIVKVSRSGRPNYISFYNYADADALINATPIGAREYINEKAVNVVRFQRLMHLVDLVYSTAHTPLMAQAEHDYVPSVNGLPMFVYSAALACHLFTGQNFSEADVEQICKTVSLNMKNIVLIGMEDSEKEKIALALSTELGRKIYILDAEMEKRLGGRRKTAFVRKHMPVRYRTAETALLQELCCQNGKIIVCSGGIVSPRENRPILKRNCDVFWIQKDMSRFVSKDRAQRSDLGSHELYRYRDPLYMESAQFVININSGDSTESTVKKILDALHI